MKKWYKHLSKNAACFGLLLLISAGAVGQTTKTDTSKTKQKILPELQLEEYTITGLSRIKLPEMDRKVRFIPVKIAWNANHSILLKQSPAILFNFSRIKPSLLHLYEFPWLQMESYGGSFETFGLKLDTQFKTGKWFPFLSSRFEDSQGHVTNANYTFAGLKGGFHFMPGGGQTLTVGTDYRFRKTGLWADSTLQANNEKAQTTLWNSFLTLKQNWTASAYSNWHFSFFSDEQDNAYNQTEQGWQAAGEIGLQGERFGFKGKADYRDYQLSPQAGWLTPANTADIKRSLFSGLAEVSFQKSYVKLMAGFRFQQAKTGTKKQFHNPTVALSLGKPGRLILEAEYAPQLTLQRALTVAEFLPFFDVVALPVTEHEQLLRSRLSFHPGSQLMLQLGYRLEKSKDYLVFRIFPDSLGYTGWFSQSVDKAKNHEITARVKWQPLKSFRLNLAVYYRQSEIEQYRADSRAVGKYLPYTPELKIQSRMTWIPNNKWELVGVAAYTGKQYADLANTREIDPYPDLGLKIAYRFSGNFSVFMRGENLLDYDYEKWFGYKAPGITLQGGFRVKL